MIEKIDIKDPSIAEEVRKNIAIATVSQKGLLSEKSVRFVNSSGIHIPKRTACIKLYSASGMTSVTAIISTGRVEAGRCGVYILSFTMANAGEFSCAVNKINTGLSAIFYYVKDGNKASIYLVTTVDYSVTNISPLLEQGVFTYHLTEDTLPEGAVEIPIS